MKLLSVLLFVLGLALVAAETCEKENPIKIEEVKTKELTLVTNYDDNQDCRWFIEIDLDEDVEDRDKYKFIAVEIIEPFQTEAQPGCQSGIHGDYVKFISREKDPGTDWDLLGLFCGSQPPRNQPLYTERDNDILEVRFVSDSSISGFDGVKIKYWPVKEVPEKPILGGLLHTSCHLDEDLSLSLSADLDENGFYLHNEDIEWTIEPSNGGTVNVEFEQFFLERCGNQDNDTCDYVELNGFGSSDGFYTGSLESNEHLKNLEGAADGKSVSIRLKTDGSIARPNGFRFNYREEC